MRRIYLALGAYLVLFVLLEGGLGLALSRGAVPASYRTWHVTAGLFLSIFVCFVHSLIFVHLLGTGLGIKRAIAELKLDEGPQRELHRIKMRAFPPAFLCMALAIVTAVTGGAILARQTEPTVHRVLSLVLLLANSVVFPVVARALADNETVLRRVEEALAAPKHPSGGSREG